MARYAAILALLFLSSCQTSRFKEFEAIRGGMTKGEVLTAVGGPNRTQRWHGRDRWEYTLRGPNGEVVREVHFENGRSTYVGAAIKPAVSADEQDRKNLLSNHAADLNESENAALAREGVTVQKFKSVEESEDATAK